jgi:hypothetical protein
MIDEIKFTETELVDAKNNITNILKFIKIISKEIGNYISKEWDEIQFNFSDLANGEDFINIEFVDLMYFEKNICKTIYDYDLFWKDFLNPQNKINEEIKRLKTRNLFKE